MWNETRRTKVDEAREVLHAVVLAHVPVSFPLDYILNRPAGVPDTEWWVGYSNTNIYLSRFSFDTFKR